MAEKNKGGRPKKFTAVEELQQKIDNFFVDCEEKEDIPDIEGLAYYLNTTRKTLFEYEKQEEFSNTIKRTKDKIFYFKKQLAFKGKINPAVFIFDAKNNHDYRDKMEVESTNNNLNQDVTDLTPEERQARIDELIAKRGN